jgi:hypothetical protein
MFLCFPDPSLFVRIRILPSTSKKIRKALTSSSFLLFCDFFLTFYLSRMMSMYLKKVINKKTSGKKLIVFWHLVSYWRKKQVPDPQVSVTDPRIRISTKMPRIYNTGFLRTNQSSRGESCGWPEAASFLWLHQVPYRLHFCAISLRYLVDWFVSRILYVVVIYMSVLCSDMCTYTCNVCGKVFTQRRIKKHLEREHKKSPTKLNYQTARLVYYRSLPYCYLLNIVLID